MADHSCYIDSDFLSGQHTARCACGWAGPPCPYEWDAMDCIREHRGEAAVSPVPQPEPRCPTCGDPGSIHPYGFCPKPQPEEKADG